MRLLPLRCDASINTGFRVLVALVLLLLGSPSGAQEYTVFTFDSAVFNKEPVLLRRFEVLDFRGDTGTLGFVPLPGLTQRLFVSQVPFIELLKGFGQRYYRPGPIRGKNLVMVLRSFRVEQSTLPLPQVAFIRQRSSWYLKDGDHYAHLFDTTTSIEAYSIRIPAAINRLVLELFASAIRRVPGEHAFVFQRSDIKANDTLWESVPALRGEAPRKGVYYSFEELRANSPGDTDVIKIDMPHISGYTTEFYKVRGRGRRGGRLQKNNYYAIYTGSYWVKGNASNGVRMRTAGGRFLFQDFYTGLADQPLMYHQGGALSKKGRYVAVDDRLLNEPQQQRWALRSSRATVLYDCTINLRTGAPEIIKRADEDFLP